MSTIALPPSYSTSDVFNTNNAHVNISNDPFSPLPAYSPATRRSTTARSVVSAPPKEFNYDLQKKGKLFAEMTIVAESGFSKTLPTFLEGQPVKGRVKLCVDKPDSFNAIIVHVSTLDFGVRLSTSFTPRGRTEMLSKAQLWNGPLRVVIT